MRIVKSLKRNNKLIFDFWFVFEVNNNKQRYGLNRVNIFIRFLPRVRINKQKSLWRASLNRDGIKTRVNSISG